MKPGFAFIDTETTGLGKGARVIEIAVVVYDFKGNLKDSHESLLAGDGTVGNYYAQEAHKIEIHQLRDAPKFKSIWAEFETLLNGNFVIAHNSQFDRSRLSYELALMGRRGLPEFSCSVKLARALKYATYAKDSGTLATLVELFDIDAQATHEALADCQALAGIFFYMFRSHPKEVTEFLARVGPYISQSADKPKSGRALTR